MTLYEKLITVLPDAKVYPGEDVPEIKDEDLEESPMVLYRVETDNIIRTLAGDRVWSVPEATIEVYSLESSEADAICLTLINALDNTSVDEGKLFWERTQKVSENFVSQMTFTILVG